MANVEVPRVRVLVENFTPYRYNKKEGFSLPCGEAKGATFLEALRISKEEGTPLISNEHATSVFRNHPSLPSPHFDEQGMIALGMYPSVDRKIAHDSRNYPFQKVEHFWTGTLDGYVAPGQPFGDMISHGGLSLPIPKQYQDLVDCALVIPTQSFMIDGLGRVWSEELHVVRDFPAGREYDSQAHSYENVRHGTYLPDESTKMPAGPEIERGTTDGFNLFRLNGTFFGPVVRGDGDHGIRGYNIHLHYEMTSEFGVVVEESSVPALAQL